MRVRAIAALLVAGTGGISAIGCGPKLPNIMTLPARCDTVPPAVAPGTRWSPSVPEVKIASPGDGALVGTVVRRGTRQPVRAQLTLRPEPESTGRRAPGEQLANSLGGFSFGRLAPGEYELYTRALSHRPDRRRVFVRAGLVDTVRLELQYEACIGY